MKYLLWVIRIVVGVLFIFSGLVKANDPMGLVYKMLEFLEALGVDKFADKYLHIHDLTNYAFYLSIIMIAFEVLCGVAVLIGAAFRFFSVILLLLNGFFLFITAYALFTGTVKECGCFGACIKISNDATFYKDVVLTSLAIFLLIYRKRVHPAFHRYPMTAIMILSAFFAVGVQWWTLEHLPFYDCLAYKPGNNLWQKMQVPTGPGIVADSFTTIMIYEKDGVKKEFTMQNYPWQDSTWKFIDSKSELVRKGNAEPEIHDFAITDSNKVDRTKDLLTAPGYTFFWFVKDPDKARMDNLDRLRRIIVQSHKLGINFYIISSGTVEQNNSFLQRLQLNDVPMYTLDGTVSKTAMRTNPGLMLLKDGTVQYKWSFRDYPKNIFLDNGKFTYQ
jgi:uncharacterized membrane protein YphA (DoxX/SURF4 family)